MKAKIPFDGENFRVRIVSRAVREVQQNFEIVQRPLIALCIPYTRDGQVLLLSQYRAAIDDTSLEFPAGRVTSTEDSRSAVRRELLEEIGFVTDSIEHVGSLQTAPHFSDERVDVFVAKGHVTQPPTPTAKEDAIKVVIVPKRVIYDLIRDGRLVDAKSIAAFSQAAARSA